jgi:hypothetical protein
MHSESIARRSESTRDEFVVVRQIKLKKKEKKRKEKGKKQQKRENKSVPSRKTGSMGNATCRKRI